MSIEKYTFMDHLGLRFIEFMSKDFLLIRKFYSHDLNKNRTAQRRVFVSVDGPRTVLLMMLV